MPHAGPVRRVLETALYVDDLERATRFYGDVLGLRVLMADDRIVALDASGGTLLLLFRRGATREGAETPGGRIPHHDGSGPAHVAFAIDAEGLEDWCEHFFRVGVAVESRVEWPAGGRSVYVRDPDGHSIELATPGIWPTY